MLPVRLVPVTVNVLETALSLTTVPNASDEAVVVMLGTTHMPVAVTVLLVAPPPLMVMLAECEPSVVGL